MQRAPYYSLMLLLGALSVLSVLSACSTGRMAEFARDPQTGRRETIEYTKFYDAGGWLQDGKIGLQLAVTHEKKFVPCSTMCKKGWTRLGCPAR